MTEAGATSVPAAATAGMEELDPNNAFCWKDPSGYVTLEQKFDPPLAANVRETEYVDKNDPEVPGDPVDGDDDTVDVAMLASPQA